MQKNNHNRFRPGSFLPGMVLFCCLIPFVAGAADWNPFPDTGQTTCYDVAGNVITCPAAGQALHGQDAQYDGSVPSYQDNGDGTVTDMNTTLMWQQTDDGTLRMWFPAKDYCTALGLAGYEDWRLPEILELQSIADYGRVNLAINPVFSCQSSNYSRYWSATTHQYDQGLAWTISFLDGGDYAWPKTNALNTYYVRCVRDEL